ncbi:MAG: penicillin-binding protein 1C [Bacteroidetes bacterium]|nr:penicillin-binding protein 1C [Bacteroidota bacterium]MBU1116010.1 penicillin-binding protein 1C [Bacteroidota bacterium]MBU1799222.1 penicillin-binding protein 1C [Bacteroidota bacterium]
MFPIPEPKEYSQVIYAKDSTMLAAYLTSDDKWRLETKVSDITPEMVQAIINKEDKWFYWHFGFNPFSIVRAFASNITSDNRISGASTITMQIARIMEPGERSYFNKLLEIFRAIQLELHFSKKELLEIYLSNIPMGGNIEGVKAASLLYFNKLPKKLSLSQSVLLTIIPNNPNKNRLDIPNESIIRKRNNLLLKFRGQNLFSNESISDALEEKVESHRYNIQNFAPHFTQVINSSSKETEIFTTLIPKIQLKCTKLLENHVNRSIGKGVTNGAVLVIENTRNSIIAYCGSSDFYNSETAGQVNGITSIRSPGSALKPFLYSQALNNGVITPKSKLLDVPTDFGSYAPENYEREFNGEVTVDYALVNSLNVPAVRLLQKIGFQPFINLLESLNFKEIERQEKTLGLSVILGGCGVTLEELTIAYSIFANKGKLRAINCFNNKLIEDEKQILSEETSYLISNILSSLERTESPNLISSVSKLPNIAWKTGTSYGRRDAWAIGYNKSYTIGVWMGNFDGKGSPYLSGSEMAVPLLFSLFNSIDYENSANWFHEPVGISTRDVCKNSGLIPSENCTDIIRDYYIENVSSNEKCNHIQEIYVNEDETESYCLGCLHEKKYKIKKYSFYQPELALWYKKSGVSFNSPPKHNENCEVMGLKNGLKILSPSAEFEYLLEKYVNQEVMLLATSNTDVKEIFWYVNKKYFGKTNLGEKLFFKPINGLNNILCVDDKGGESSLTIKVKFY